MLTEKSTERKSQPQMKKKGTALLASLFPLYMQMKLFNIEGYLQIWPKNAISQIFRLKPEIQG
jgi:hypothetical protein